MLAMNRFFLLLLMLGSVLGGNGLAATAEPTPYTVALLLVKDTPCAGTALAAISEALQKGGGLAVLNQNTQSLVPSSAQARKICQQKGLDAVCFITIEARTQRQLSGGLLGEASLALRAYDWQGNALPVPPMGQGVAYYSDSKGALDYAAQDAGTKIGAKLAEVLQQSLNHQKGLSEVCLEGNYGDPVLESFEKILNRTNGVLNANRKKVNKAGTHTEAIWQVRLEDTDLARLGTNLRSNFVLLYNRADEKQIWDYKGILFPPKPELAALLTAKVKESWGRYLTFKVEPTEKNQTP